MAAKKKAAAKAKQAPKRAPKPRPQDGHVRLRVLRSFGTLVDGVAICPGKGTEITRGRSEADRLIASGVAEEIMTPERMLVQAAKQLGVGLITDRAPIISAAAAEGVGVVRPGGSPKQEEPKPAAPAEGEGAPAA